MRPLLRYPTEVQLKHHMYESHREDIRCSWPGCDDTTAFKTNHELSVHTATVHRKLPTECWVEGCKSKSKTMALPARGLARCPRRTATSCSRQDIWLFVTGPRQAIGRRDGGRRSRNRREASSQRPRGVSGSLGLAASACNKNTAVSRRRGTVMDAGGAVPGRTKCQHLLCFSEPITFMQIGEGAARSRSLRCSMQLAYLQLF